MSWIRLDDQFADHPKVIAAGPLAAWLFVCGLTYCARYLTDGFIPATSVRRLADVDNTDSLVTALLTVGLWEVAEGGYRVHDYLDYQPSAKQVHAERAANAQRQANWRVRQRSNGVTNVSRNAVSNGAPIPSHTHPIERERDVCARARGDDPPEAKAASLSLSSETEATAEAEAYSPPTAVVPQEATVDPKAARAVEHELFDAWCAAVGRVAKGAERRNWVQALGGMHDDYGLSPPDVASLVAQYRAKLGGDRCPTPGQVAGIYSQLGVNPHVPSVLAGADDGHRASNGLYPADYAERKRAALARLGVPPPANHRAAAANGHGVPRGPDG